MFIYVDVYVYKNIKSDEFLRIPLSFSFSSLRFSLVFPICPSAFLSSHCLETCLLTSNIYSFASYMIHTNCRIAGPIQLQKTKLMFRFQDVFVVVFIFILTVHKYLSYVQNLLQLVSLFSSVPL